MQGQDRGSGTGESGVIPLVRGHDDIRFPAANLLRRYWAGLRGPRPVPSRAEVDPRAIEDALEYAFILERIAPGVGRFRLAGMHLNDLMGMEVRGMPLTSLFLPGHRATVSRALEEVFAAPATATLALAGERGIGRPPMDGQLLLLPLTSDLGDVSRALGCLCTVGPVGRTPRRFAVGAQQVVPVGSETGAGGPAARQARHGGECPLPAGGGSAGLEEPAAPYGPQPAPPRVRPGGKPRLYLVRTRTEKN